MGSKWHTGLQSEGVDEFEEDTYGTGYVLACLNSICVKNKTKNKSKILRDSSDLTT